MPKKIFRYINGDSQDPYFLGFLAFKHSAINVEAGMYVDGGFAGRTSPHPAFLLALGTKNERLGARRLRW